jgi:hypothetical protein
MLSLALIGCSSSDPVELKKVEVLSYDYVQYNYVTGIGVQYSLRASLKNNTNETKSGLVVFNFEDVGNRANDLYISYSLEPGQEVDFSYDSPVFVSYNSSLVDVYLQ